MKRDREREREREIRREEKVEEWMSVVVGNRIHTHSVRVLTVHQINVLSYTLHQSINKS